MTIAPRWNERDAAQALLAVYRNDYDIPGKPCGECHCKDCMEAMKRSRKKPCCALALLLMQAEQIVKRARARRGVSSRRGAGK